LNELDSRNLTALLVFAIEKSVLSRKATKDDEFYDSTSISVCCEAETCRKSIPSCPGVRAERWRLRRRQLLGSYYIVQMMRAAPTAPSHAAKDALIFIAVPQCESAFAGQGEDTVTVLEDRFLAARENRFMPSPGYRDGCFFSRPFALVENRERAEGAMQRLG